MSARRRRPEELWDLFPDEHHYSVTFSIEAACTTPRVEPDQYTDTITGEVNVTQGGAEERIGTLHAYRLRRDLAAAEGVSFFDIADAFSAQAFDYLLEVFDERGNVRPDVERLLGEELIGGPVLMAHTLQIDPAHRGCQLGYAVINSFIETFQPGVGFVIARTAPIAPPGLRPDETDTPEYRRRRARGVQKLREYWEMFGFIPLAADSEFVAMNLWRRRPSLVQAIRAWRSRKRRQAGKRRPPNDSGRNDGGVH